MTNDVQLFSRMYNSCHTRDAFERLSKQVETIPESDRQQLDRYFVVLYVYIKTHIADK